MSEAFLGCIQAFLHAPYHIIADIMHRLSMILEVVMTLLRIYKNPSEVRRNESMTSVTTSKNVEDNISLTI